MTHKKIISELEAQQIRSNELRKAALEQHAAELKNATEQQKREIMKRIERDIRKVVREEYWLRMPINVIY